MATETATFAEKLRAALEEKDISVRALARRMAKVTGASLEQERRRLNRYLGVRPSVPTSESRRLIEECLGVKRGTLQPIEEAAQQGGNFRDGARPVARSMADGRQAGSRRGSPPTPASGDVAA